MSVVPALGAGLAERSGDRSFLHKTGIKTREREKFSDGSFVCQTTGDPWPLMSTARNIRLINLLFFARQKRPHLRWLDACFFLQHETPYLGLIQAMRVVMQELAILM